MVQSGKPTAGMPLREALVELEPVCHPKGRHTQGFCCVKCDPKAKTRLANQIAELRQDINSLQNSIRSMTDGTTQAMNRARDAPPQPT
ncbi:hypothetical protein PGTUg99_004099 [Puccinia graminis f. sp. tritici]|uniref:Uncharacterized protein n=1 Tax=Puccinia graminis f. sp. tritici TaxID=56615 RepID=A0A5B0QDI0_PUCGR|nr:hypothetical protein PGTUg99_004099 [Puccinia graminis f. sp. tritici]